MSLSAKLALPDGTTLQGRTENLSCAGFQIVSGREAVACLFPHTRQPGPRERRHAHVLLGGQEEDALAVPLEAECAAVFARRTSESAWQIGFEFLEPDTRLVNWLQARIASALRGAGNAL